MFDNMISVSPFGGLGPIPPSCSDQNLFLLRLHDYIDAFCHIQYILSTRYIHIIKLFGDFFKKIKKITNTSVKWHDVMDKAFTSVPLCEALWGVQFVALSKLIRGSMIGKQFGFIFSEGGKKDEYPPISAEVVHNKNIWNASIVNMALLHFRNKYFKFYECCMLWPKLG